MSGFCLALVVAAILYVHLRGKLNFSDTHQSNLKVKEINSFFLYKNIVVYFLSVEAGLVLS